MPKGVEHFNAAIPGIGVVPVVRSLMPKGVEHYQQIAPQLPVRVVVRSLMPKGVEHMNGSMAASGV